MKTVSPRPCTMCGGVTVAAGVVAPYAMIVDATGRHMVPAVNVVAVSACPTCDRPRCPNKGCGMPTGPLLPLGQREITPTVCDHCNKAIAYKGRRRG